MLDSYSLSRGQAQACRIMGALFLGSAVAMILLSIGVSFWPDFSDALCGAKGDCGYYEDVLAMLPSEARAKIAASPAVAARFSAHVYSTPVSLGLDMLSIAEFAPLCVLLGCVGIAQRRLGAPTGDGLAGALPWLRRAALTAVVLAILSPLTASLRAMLLLPGVDGHRSWYIMADLGEIALNLMFAFAALSVSWALSAGSRARSDIAEII